MRGLDLQDEFARGIWFVRGTGILDASTIEPFNGLIDEIFRRGCYRVCLDATRLERVSATGIGVLLAANARAQGEGGALVLVSPPDLVQAALDALGVSGQLTVAADPATAARALGEWG